MEVVEDEEVEEEEEDMEVAQIFNEKKSQSETSQNYDWYVYNVIHVGEVRDILYECNALNSTHVGEVRDTSLYL